MAERAVMAEFASPELLLAAVRSFRDSGETRLAAYTPYSVPDVEDALGLSRSWISYVTLVSGLLGAGVGLGLQWYLNGVNYPVIVGGFPPQSLLAFVPITFETMILFAVLATFGALLFAARLPQLWHPVFDVPEFASVTNDGFWLAVGTEDIAASTERLRTLGATTVVDALVGVA